MIVLGDLEQHIYTEKIHCNREKVKDSMIKIFLLLSTLCLVSCSKKNEIITSTPKKMSRSDVKSMQKEIRFSPKPGDLSPKGFNWVHFDFAYFFSGVFYQHNFKGKYRKKVLLKKKKKLFTYLETLKNVKYSNFKTWNQKHKTSFLINTYHASLIKLMIEQDFKDLENKIYRKPKKVSVFNKSYSLEEFIKKEMISHINNYWVAFSLKCFEKNCPEFRNTIYNFKNIESMIKVSATRYFIDPDIEYLDKGRIKLPYIQSLFLPLMPKHQSEFKVALENLLKNIQEAQDRIGKIDTHQKLSF